MYICLTLLALINPGGAAFNSAACSEHLHNIFPQFLYERSTVIERCVTDKTRKLTDASFYFFRALLPAWLEKAAISVCHGQDARNFPEFSAVVEFLETLNGALRSQGSDGLSLVSMSIGNLRKFPIADPQRLFLRVDQWTTVVARLVAKVAQHDLILAGRRQLSHWRDWGAFDELDTEIQARNFHVSRNVTLSSKTRPCTVVVVDEQTESEILREISASLIPEATLVMEDVGRLGHELKLRPRHLADLASRGFRVCWRRHAGTLDTEISIRRCLSNAGLRQIRRVDLRTWKRPDFISLPFPSGSSEVGLGRVLSEYTRRHAEFVASEGGEKVLVFVCNPLHACGGTGDRVNGLVTAFLLAVISDRLFFVDVDAPYDLSVLLKPRMIDWRLAKPSYGLVTEFQAFIDRREDFVNEFESLVESEETVMAWAGNHRLTEAILEKGAKYKPDLVGRLKNIEFLASEIFEYLFYPSAYLVSEVEQTYRRIFGTSEPIKYVAIHFRAGDVSKESWTDPARHSLKADLPKFLECAEIAEEGERLPWLLSADVSEAKIREALMDRPDWLQRLRFPDDGGVMHVDRSFDLGQQLIGTVQVQVAHMLLARASAAVMSRSYFGETAAEIGRIDKVYFYEGCVLTDLASS